MPAESWFLVGKPLRAPFSDGSTVLVRDLVSGLPGDRPLTYFGDENAPVREVSGDEVIPTAPMGHAPGLLAKVGVLGNIVRPARRRQPLHFFFTPNRVTSSVLAMLRRMQPRRLMVQTLMSSDRVGEFVEFLAPLDAVIVLSDHTAKILAAAGMAADKVKRVHPGVAMVEPIADVTASRRLLYAGDLDAAVADRLCAVGKALDRPELAGWSLTIAARPKADDDAVNRGRLTTELAEGIAAGRVEVLGEISDMDALMRSSAIQLFIADHVRKKVDLPLVVLEGMARGLGLVAVDFAPLCEIFERAEAHGLRPGASVPAQDPNNEALVAAVTAAAADPKILLTWSRDAHALSSKEFSIERMAQNYAQLYAELETDHGFHR